MDLSKVKLVVADMDGTLLNSKGQVSGRFFHIYKELKKHNIQFVAASGRQYYSIINKLNGIKNEIIIIAENGGITKHGDRELAVTKMDPKSIPGLIDLLRSVDNSYLVLCGKKTAYIETRDQNFISMFREYYSEYTIVEDLSKVRDDDFFKIAIYHFENSETYIYPAVAHLENKMQVKVSGKNWLDISHPRANKGNALKNLQDKLGISKAETMVFGDYNNDLEMIELAYFSYAMENAHPNVKKAARFQTNSNNEEGVELILEQLLSAKI